MSRVFVFLTPRLMILFPRGFEGKIVLIHDMGPSHSVYSSINDITRELLIINMTRIYP